LRRTVGHSLYPRTI